jgi:hypothetical protein
MQYVLQANAVFNGKTYRSSEYKFNSDKFRTPLGMEETAYRFNVFANDWHDRMKRGLRKKATRSVAR